LLAVAGAGLAAGTGVVVGFVEGFAAVAVGEGLGEATVGFFGSSLLLLLLMLLYL
jgi:hypothetical protein